MKKLLILALGLSTTLPSQAQLFSRDNLGPTILGGILGGVIGHNSGHRTAEGVGIGAGAGLLLGTLSNDYRRQAGYQSFYAPEQSYYGGDPYRYATTGAVLGGIAGGVIGHNNGHRTAEGIAIGAGSGLLLGAIADESLRNRTAYYSPGAAYPAVSYEAYPFHRYYPRAVPVFVTQPAVVTTPIASGYVAPAASTAPVQAQTVIINNYYGGGSPMAGANSLFGR